MLEHTGMLASHSIKCPTGLQGCRILVGHWGCPLGAVAVGDHLLLLQWNRGLFCGQDFLIVGGDDLLHVWAGGVRELQVRPLEDLAQGPILGEAFVDQGEESCSDVGFDIHGVRWVLLLTILPRLHLLLELEVVAVLALLQGVLVEGLGLVEEVLVGAEYRQPFVRCWPDVFEHIWWVV